MNQSEPGKFDLTEWINNQSAETQPNQELEPWLVFAEARACTWSIGSLDSEALAIFSSKDLAHKYASQVAGNRIEQLSGRALLHVLIAAFKANVEYLALDPNSSECRQVFGLRNVLRSAKHQYSDK